MAEKKPTKKEIRESLILQLAVLGAQREHYIDLIEDYMKFWDVKKKLQTDITKRGVVYKDLSSVGVPIQKNNPSVKELVMVNRQMLAILKELGITVQNTGGDDDDEL